MVNNGASRNQWIGDVIGTDEMKRLERLHDGLYWLEWFKEYPRHCITDEQYYTDEWVTAFNKYGDKVVEIFMMKHGDTDARILGPRLVRGRYQRDIINIINFLMYRDHDS